jgi:hypothetical protein
MHRLGNKNVLNPGTGCFSLQADDTQPLIKTFFKHFSIV